MKPIRLNSRLGLAMLLVFALPLAACGSPASAVAPTPATTATPLANGEYAGQLGTIPLPDFGLSTDGQQVIAYLCDGTSDQQSLAEWFKGPVTNGAIDITNVHGTRLVASLTPQAVTGTITLKDGRSFPVNIPIISNPGSDFGIYRSEQTFKGVQYLGGWLNLPATATSGVGRRAGTGLARPAFVTCCVPGSRDRGAIINEKTGALLPSPEVEAFSNLMSLEDPGLGTFTLHLCRQGQC